jgi:hypothetical protein
MLIFGGSKIINSRLIQCVIICIFYMSSSQPTVYELVNKATLDTRAGSFHREILRVDHNITGH